MHNTQDTQKPIGFLLKTLDRLLEERFDEALERHRLSRRQWQLLNVLADTEATVAQLDEAIAPFLDTPTQETSERHLEPLLGGGLVAEKAGVYRLTDLGRVELHGARETVQGIRDITVKGLEDGEYDRTVRALEAMISNLAG
ncbi:MarR family transcriptional regulator [Sinomonas sp. ASV486]|uniref:MarR family transcriptional regulator n=1 Tax=Sinomonas puerhi TaxID=3238584 RepID=A0AB39KYL8_9MICC|nr:MarR family transcriptional regulator [Sinomonas sp. ASV486]MDQ4491539.1 MarR family transcriptional regulator [Sinomonas sp. ASV486]